MYCEKTRLSMEIGLQWKDHDTPYQIQKGLTCILQEIDHFLKTMTYKAIKKLFSFSSTAMIYFEITDMIGEVKG
jgi:hypothetical protein